MEAYKHTIKFRINGEKIVNLCFQSDDHWMSMYTVHSHLYDADIGDNLIAKVMWTMGCYDKSHAYGGYTVYMCRINHRIMILELTSKCLATECQIGH